jgi:hypothetical protein
MTSSVLGLIETHKRTLEACRSHHSDDVNDTGLDELVDISEEALDELIAAPPQTHAEARAAIEWLAHYAEDLDEWEKVGPYLLTLLRSPVFTPARGSCA